MGHGRQLPTRHWWSGRNRTSYRWETSANVCGSGTYGRYGRPSSSVGVPRLSKNRSKVVPEPAATPTMRLRWRSMR
ncbi:hypothetical protein [Streptomyces avermitilis]|uniref:hypothetical protein n=1 Tax=Streptomyces avermitilis TaxID=33903 RepID=UPI0033DD262A